MLKDTEHLRAMGWRVKSEIEKIRLPSRENRWVFKIFASNSVYPDYTSHPFKSLKELKNELRLMVAEYEEIYKRNEVKNGNEKD